MKYFIFTVLFSSVVFAQNYPSALPNHNLKQELDADPQDRKIPQPDWVSAAVDGQVYFRPASEANAQEDFYHGIGYWIQARTELRPQEFFSMNIRSLFYSGSVSYGYTNSTESYHLFGFNGIWPELVYGGTLTGRAIDLERQTAGQGLLMEEKEMAGLLISWKRDETTVKLRGDGTGTFFLKSDMRNLEIETYSGLATAGIINWAEDDIYGTGERITIHPYTYLSSTAEMGKNTSYFAELGFRNKKIAGLLGFKNESDFDDLTLRSRLQYRRYEDEFGDNFVGNVQQMYIAYDQYDKRFTNAGNIFVIDDNVDVYSAILDADYVVNEKWSANMRNEYAVFDYKAYTSKDYYLCRIGATNYPVAHRRESLTIYLTNKMPIGNYNTPPYRYGLSNEMAFRQSEPILGVEGNFRF